MRTFEEIKNREMQRAMHHKEVWEQAEPTASLKDDAIQNADEIMANIDAATKIIIVNDMRIHSRIAHADKLDNVSKFEDGTLSGSYTGLNVNDPEFAVLKTYKGLIDTPNVAEELFGLIAERYNLDLDQLLEINEEIKEESISFNINGKMISGDLESYNQPPLSQDKSR